jgi:glycosyltransferase involved in cell wall biosynthesis
MGLTALEAMACGAAVIVPQTGGSSSFARDGENSLIADTCSIAGCLKPLGSLAVDKDLRERLRQQCIRDACAYSPEVAALNILDTLFASPRGKLDPC